MVGLPCVVVLFAGLQCFRSGMWDSSFVVAYSGAGFVVGVVFYALPGIVRPFYVVWYALACCIGLVVGNVVLALIFYLLVTGIGLLKRLGGRQPIRKRPDRLAKSYWIAAPPAPAPHRYYRQF